MGNNQDLIQQLQHQSPNLNQWKRNQGSALFNHIRKPQIQIQQYSMIVSSKSNLQALSKMYKFRKYHQLLVSSLYLRFQNTISPCSDNVIISIFLERVRLRLNQFRVSTIQDIFHLYYMVLNGFFILTKYFNCFFKVSKLMVGINFRKVVKVWHSQNLQQMHLTNAIQTQKEMLCDIINFLREQTQTSAFFEYLIQEITKYNNFNDKITCLENLSKKYLNCIPNSLKQQFEFSPKKVNIKNLFDCSKEKTMERKISLKNLSHEIKKINKPLLKQQLNYKYKDQQNKRINRKTFQNARRFSCVQKPQTQREFISHKNPKFFFNNNQVAVLPQNAQKHFNLIAQIPKLQKMINNTKKSTNFLQPIKAFTNQQVIKKQISPLNQTVPPIEQSIIFNEFGRQKMIQQYRKSHENVYNSLSSSAIKLNSSRINNLKNSQQKYITIPQKLPISIKRPTQYLSTVSKQCQHSQIQQNKKNCNFKKVISLKNTNNKNIINNLKVLNIT